MTLRIGVIGVGFIGRLHTENLAHGIPGLELVAAADPSEAARAWAGDLGVTAVSDWRDLLDTGRVDALVLASPAADHPDQVVDAAKAGIHVYCEKPLAITLDEADRAVDAVDAAGTVLRVGFNRRFDTNFSELERQVRAGRVGRPLIVRISSRDSEIPPASYPRDRGRMFMDTTIHDFDMARYLADDDIVEVSAFSSASLDPIAADNEDADTAVVLLRFASGALGVIDNSRQSPYGYDQRAEVHGTLGAASVGNVTKNTVQIADAGGFNSEVLPKFFPERYAQSYVDALLAFAAAVRGEDAPGATGPDSRAALAAALAAQAAHETGVVQNLATTR
jgi:myo-inositol 2-dehydrogenase/D-chiro-inositol 1-dehydrogenase